MGNWQILFWVLFGVVILIFMTQNIFLPALKKKSAKKSKDKQEEAMAGIKKGAKVITTSGMYGTIVKVHKNDFDIEFCAGTTIRCSKHSIAGFFKDKEK